jgi:amino acid transporter
MGVDGSERTVDYVAAAAIVVTAAVNVRGVRLGAAVAGLSTIAKFGALLFLVGSAFLLGGQHGATFDHFTDAGGPVAPALFGLALVSVLWAYDGFADVSFAAGEIKDPQRTLPRAIVAGTVAILAIYMAVNAAYLYVAPLPDVARSPLVAADTMERLFGNAGVTLVSIVVALSTFGALMGIMLAAPRIFFAMANDGLFFRAMGRVHPEHQTPHVAIMFAAALGVVFVLTRTFEQLADTFVISIWPFYGLAIAGLYRLRVTRPELARPYRVPGYPIVPAIFLAGVLYLVGSAIAGDPIGTGVTFAAVLLGLPVYAVIRPRGRQRARGL